MNSNELLGLIFKKHNTKLKNLDISHSNQIMILFSGVPGSGKTRLAKKIEKEYRAVRYENDMVRGILESFPKEYFKNVSANSLESFNNIAKKTLLRDYGYDKLLIKKENLLQDYKKYFLSGYSFQNKLIIFDGSVDRSFYSFRDFSKEFNFKLFLIKMPFDKNRIRKRMINRGEGDMTFFDKNLPRWKNDYDELNKKVKADFKFKDNLGELFEKLEGLISKN